MVDEYQWFYDLGFKLNTKSDAWTEFIYETKGFKLEVYLDYADIWGIELNGEHIPPPTTKYPRDIYNETKLLIRKHKLKKILNESNTSKCWYNNGDDDC